MGILVLDTDYWVLSCYVSSITTYSISKQSIRGIVGYVCSMSCYKSSIYVVENRGSRSKYYLIDIKIRKSERACNICRSSSTIGVLCVENSVIVDKTYLSRCSIRLSGINICWCENDTKSPDIVSSLLKSHSCFDAKYFCAI